MSPVDSVHLTLSHDFLGIYKVSLYTMLVVNSKQRTSCLCGIHSSHTATSRPGKMCVQDTLQLSFLPLPLPVFLNSFPLLPPTSTLIHHCYTNSPSSEYPSHFIGTFFFLPHKKGIISVCLICPRML